MNLSNETRHAVAVRQMAHAVLTMSLGCDEIVAVTIEPRVQALGYVQFDRDRQPIPTAEETEYRIIQCLAGLAAEKLAPGLDVSSHASSLSRANALAQQLADSEEPTWRQTRPELVQTILDTCRQRADQLVDQHQAKIIKMAGILVEQGTLTGDQLEVLYRS